MQARDRYGNKRITGGDVVRANSWYMGAKRKQLCSQRESAAVCWPQRYTTEGFYSCTRPPEGGSAAMYLWIAETSTCMSLDGLTTAPEEWIKYTWQTVDFVSLNQARIPVADENTGQYQIQYLTNRSGFYNVDVYMVPILNDGSESGMVLIAPEALSPFRSNRHLRQRTDPSCSVMGWEMVLSSRKRRKRGRSIVGVDKFGNERLRSGLQSVDGDAEDRWI